MAKRILFESLALLLLTQKPSINWNASRLYVAEFAKNFGSATLVMEGMKMSRRRRKQPVSLLTAVFVEVGTVIGMLAVAQPTWTRGIIESVGKSSAGSQVVSSQVVAAEPHIAQAHNSHEVSWNSIPTGYPQSVLPPRLGSLTTQGGDSSYSSYRNNF